MNNSLFKRLSTEEVEKFVKWARENYEPGLDINETWHPVCRLECERMNVEVVQGKEA